MRLLLTQHYLSTAPGRQVEIDTCLIRNLGNSAFDRIVLFGEASCLERFRNYPKITTVSIVGRLTYGEALDWSEQQLTKGDTVVLANSDIYFDESIQVADQVVASSTGVATALALSRYDVDAAGGATLFNRDDSHDVWVFSLPLSLSITSSEECRKIALGMPNCNNRFNYELQAAGYQVYNYAHNIKCYHLHLAQTRGEEAGNRVAGAYSLVPVTNLPSSSSKPQRWFIHYFENGRRVYDATAGTRIANEARNSKAADGSPFFDHVLTYRKKDLGEEFIERHKEHFTYLRGGGYWCWKPWIVKLTLEKMQEGDELLYADTGCTLSGCLEPLFKCLEQQAVVPFEFWEGTKVNLEKYWTKQDLVKLLGGENCMETPQRIATYFLLKKSSESLALINRWVELVSVLRNIDDSPSVEPNDPVFIEHRHDQSGWSLLTKTANIPHRSVPNEIQPSRLSSGWNWAQP